MLFLNEWVGNGVHTWYLVRYSIERCGSYLLCSVVCSCILTTYNHKNNHQTYNPHIYYIMLLVLQCTVLLIT
mgnify:CR=1 FL=1